MSTRDRFVTPIDLSGMQEIFCDVAIFGSGIAGLTVACELPSSLNVVVFSKGLYSDGSTPYAQGGIAAAVGELDDPAFHAEDTLIAAVGTADPMAVAVLTTEAPSAIKFLIDHGVHFDSENGTLALSLEGGHSRPRIVHAGGDATGAELSRALFVDANTRGVQTINDAFLVDLLLDLSGAVAGAVVLIGGQPNLVRFSQAVLASGGAGQLFSSTTSPSTCTGDGMAAAYRAGAELADLEFVQFHPTVLMSVNDPRPLISEALRGEGAVLRDSKGERVMEGLHTLADLAPRDIVAREVLKRMHDQGVDHLFLDARSIASTMNRHFPTISASLVTQGIDPSRDLIPISPASHYSIGGVRTTVNGETSIGGLYAVGEVASVGIHGANRLASNSLLEGVVFGRRIAQRIADQPRSPTNTLEPQLFQRPSNDPITVNRDEMRQAMDRDAGVVRSRESLQRLLSYLKPIARKSAVLDQASIETMNMVLLDQLMVQGALARNESRGAHFRADFDQLSDLWQVRHLYHRGTDGSLELAKSDELKSEGIVAT